MPSLVELIAYIESQGFSARINLASGRNLLIRFLEMDEGVSALVDAIKESSEQALHVLARVEDLSRMKVNPRYENPNDTAMAVYSWALYQSWPDLGRIASIFASSAPGIWWAREIAVLIFDHQLAVQSEPDMLTTAFSQFADQPRFSFAQTGRVMPIEGDLPVLVTLVSDVYKKVIVRNFAEVAEGSDKPKHETHTWSGEEIINFVYSAASAKNTERAFGRSEYA
jgi:hypothetical protein